MTFEAILHPQCLKADLMTESCFMLNLNLAILSPGGQHLRVSAEAHAQHGVVHHHEVVLRLVLEILHGPGTHTRSVGQEEDWRLSDDG